MTNTQTIYFTFYYTCDHVIHFSYPCIELLIQPATAYELVSISLSLSLSLSREHIVVP